jgi:signal transduction histidine kinase
MDAETLGRATHPFFTTKPKGRGRGLGLASVARTVRRAGGHLVIDSTPNQGTRVLLWLSPAGESSHTPL